MHNLKLTTEVTRAFVDKYLKSDTSTLLGSIDDVAIFDRALAPWEIAALANANQGGVPSAANVR